MFNDLSSPATLAATRRSGKPRDLAAPGPDEAQLRRILSAAMRVPDHGKLAPWRFVVIPPAARPAFAAVLRDAHTREKPDGEREREALDQFAAQAPTLVAVLSTPVRTSPIPLWEQELSAGAACMMLLTAAHAEGFAGGWLTGWPAYAPGIAAALGHADGRVAGFVFLGTPMRPLEERPRPAYDSVVSTWHG